MSELKLDDDQGYTFVSLKTPTEDDPECRTRFPLDLFRANNAYINVCEEHSLPLEQCEAWIDWLQSLGFPRLSHGIAYAIAKFVMDEVDKLKKTLGFTSESAESPEPTESKPHTDSPDPGRSETLSLKAV